MSKLLTRSEFRNAVFARDGNKCVFCNNAAVDAHHIIERRLWPDGGYYINNGASVCEEHHIKCETTEVSVEQVLEACSIKKRMIPPHLYEDNIYDKWGNIILESGRRIKGELFFDESVQKILSKGPYLSSFIDYVKYPRTYHLPWSENITKDDRVLEEKDIEAFYGKEVIVTEKMDGENTSMYYDHIHARSIDSNNHKSRNWVKNFWSTIGFEIPKGWRICGENMYAKHSIKYNDLNSYFYGFSIWNNRNVCLSWPETQSWFSLLDIVSVPVIWSGEYDKNEIDKAWSQYKNSLNRESEGYVLRIRDNISYSGFKKYVGKYVRKNHVQTVQHWMHGQPIEKNILCKQ